MLDKCKVFDKFCKVMLKFFMEWIFCEEVIRLQKLDLELKVNLYIVDMFFMVFIDDGQCVVNVSYGKDVVIVGN